MSRLDEYIVAPFSDTETESALLSSLFSNTSFTLQALDSQGNPLQWLSGEYSVEVSLDSVNWSVAVENRDVLSTDDIPRVSGNAFRYAKLVTTGVAATGPAANIRLVMNRDSVGGGGTDLPFPEDDIMLKTEYDTGASEGVVDASETLRDVAYADANISKGQVLSFSSSQLVGGVAKVKPASASNPAERPALLIATEDVLQGSIFEVLESGLATGVNTNGFLAGQTVYLGLNGEISPLPFPGYTQVVGVVKEVGSEGVIYFRPVAGDTLSDLDRMKVDSISPATDIYFPGPALDILNIPPELTTGTEYSYAWITGSTISFSLSSVISFGPPYGAFDFFALFNGSTNSIVGIGGTTVHGQTTPPYGAVLHIRTIGNEVFVSEFSSR